MSSAVATCAVGLDVVWAAFDSRSGSLKVRNK